MDLAAQPAVGTAAPNFTLNLSTGGSVSLSSMFGEVVYLNFFGATCGDCIADGFLSEEVYDMFVTNSEFNIYGIEVWHLPTPYINTTFRANSGITYPLLIQGRPTAIAYNMEVEPTPSPTDVEHRGHVIIDRQGIIRYYAIYNPFDATQQAEIIAMLNTLLDPCFGIPELDAPREAAMIRMDEFGPLKICWDPVPCATRYLIFRSLSGDWTDETIVGVTPEVVYHLELTEDSLATFRVVAERIQP